MLAASRPAAATLNADTATVCFKRQMFCDSTILFSHPVPFLPSYHIYSIRAASIPAWQSVHRGGWSGKAGQSSGAACATGSPSLRTGCQRAACGVMVRLEACLGVAQPPQNRTSVPNRQNVLRARMTPRTSGSDTLRMHWVHADACVGHFRRPEWRRQRLLARNAESHCRACIVMINGVHAPPASHVKADRGRYRRPGSLVLL